MRRYYTLVMMAGVALLLVALALLLAPEQRAAAPDTLDYRLQVGEALMDLSPCLTCHSASGASQPVREWAVVRHTPLDVTPEAPSNAGMFIESTTETLKRQLDAELVDLGQRLLTLPETEANREAYAALADDYLTVYEDTRAPASEAFLLSSLDLLRGVDRALLALEHQSQPVKLARGVPDAPPCETLAAQTAPPPAPVAAPVSFTPVEPSLGPSVEARPEPAPVPSLSVVLVHRRGPPSVEAAPVLLG